MSPAFGPTQSRSLRVTISSRKTDLSQWERIGGSPPTEVHEYVLCTNLEITPSAMPYDIFSQKEHPTQCLSPSYPYGRILAGPSYSLKHPITSNNASLNNSNNA
jgi:hypothetical protein